MHIASSSQRHQSPLDRAGGAVGADNSVSNNWRQGFSMAFGTHLKPVGAQAGRR